MSFYCETTVTCCVCNTSIPHYNIAGRFLEPDLDGRIDSTRGSALKMMVMECPKCGYASRDIQEEPGIFARLYLITPTYRHFGGMKPYGKVDSAFVHAALIARLQGKHEEAARMFLHAAWNRDDHKDPPRATRYRMAAIQELRKVLRKKGLVEKGKLVVLFDLLRRTGQFQQLLSEFSNTVLEDSKYQRRLEYQLYLAKQQDSGVHTVREMLNWISEREETP